MKKGKLYLIPTLLGDSEVDAVMPANTRTLIQGIGHFVVEDLRTARRFLKKVDPAINIDALSFMLLNEHSVAEDIPALIAPLIEGKDVGLLSEAGTPCVADPGSALVSLAHDKGIRVVPISGPSSIVLALMASGFNGQNFTFHGYLPKDTRERMSAIKNLETKAYREDQTQIFIETPYRNMQLFEAIIQSCNPNTRLCIAANITTGEEMIISQQISLWKKNPPAIHKQPAVFLIYK
jgi:16S rRNA (cytidine1402-2'-O)-methyltransferase